MHWSTDMVVTYDLMVFIHTQSHQFPFQECWSVRIIHKLPDATLTMSAANLKQHINLYFNLDSLLVATLGKLSRPPLPLLPFSPLAAPANTLVSLFLQQKKATVLAETPLPFHHDLYAKQMSTDVSQICVALSPYQISRKKFEPEPGL